MKKIFVYAALFMIFTGNAYGADAILVNQPAYNAMNFYVYRPSNISEEFYATYDGYLVYKDAKGVWNYASCEKSGIKKTSYVVGSVIPSVVKLKPYDAKISSVNPVLTDFEDNSVKIRPAGTRVAPDEIISLELDTPEVLRIDVTPITKPGLKKESKRESTRAVYTPPTSDQGIYMMPDVLAQNASDHVQITNSNFAAIGRWRNSVDRIGVLDRPKIPVAWKGEYPAIIYAWTGIQWRQIKARGKHISALSTLRSKIYDLTVHANKLNALNWDDNDTNILSQYAMRWGYQWLGQLLISREY